MNVKNTNFSTGNKIADSIGKMNFTGNVIPPAWFKTIVYKNGKPNLNAIVILSDIVYWYRPSEICDKKTGRITGIKKKFKADKLQRSYGQLAEQYNLSKQQVTDAVIFLEKLGVVRRELRNIVINGRKLVNLLFIDIVPQILYKITFPENGGENDEISISVSNGKGIGTENDTYTLSVGGDMDTERDTVSVCGRTDTGLEKDTNTKNIKEINNKDLTDPINQSYVNENNEDMMDRYRECIKTNIDYETLISPEYKNDKDTVDEIVELMTEMAAINKHTVRINGNDIPSEIVKSRFMKLDFLDISYVLETMSKNNKKIYNIRAYLLTALYNSKNTINNYYGAEVRHDLYGA